VNLPCDARPVTDALTWSRCGLGTAPLGSRPAGPLWWGDQDRTVAVRTVQTAIDAGVTWIDTAPFYGWGRAEEIVGDGIAGRRDDVVVLTKCGTVRHPDGTWVEDGSPAAVRADVEASLRRLRLDRIDVVQLHDPDPLVPVEDTVGALAELVAAGSVAAIGLSNHPADLLTRGASVAPIGVVQQQWNVLQHDNDAEAARRWSVDHGARFLAWSPLASGFLTSGFRLDALHPDDLRRRLRWARPPDADRIRRLHDLAAELDEPLERLALAWSARHAFPIVGAREPAEVGLLFDVAPLDDETAARLDAAAAP
jgi:aryl-alcohol dehydrogenase-like predicted oxidoreductase